MQPILEHLRHSGIALLRIIGSSKKVMFYIMSVSSVRKNAEKATALCKLKFHQEHYFNAEKVT